ncbi:MAG TPA: hypothetical protein ENJ95_00690 [Bacteroidetes bacterium]|nr:hypothetical protein [Bacteroidota bacterium]
MTNWEYWPLYIVNIPVIVFWLWFAIRARKLFFFSAVNPAIETGGMWGESKHGILKRIPKSHLPVTVFIKKEITEKMLFEKIKTAGLSYPVIAKPDIGERGMLVSKIKNKKGLLAYFNSNKIDFLIQEYIDLPVELAVMHHRFPGAKEGKVTSVCIKETLKIIGDGKSTVLQLMEAYPRAKLQVARFKKQFPKILKTVPEKGKKVELEPIGNHCRGTRFLNGNKYIDGQLNKVFDGVAMQMKDVYYGRFDMKCKSIEDLKNGGGFKIMEYNGIGAEPAHIYDPAYPFFKKYKDIYAHWKIIYEIYKVQKIKGEKGMGLGEVAARLKTYLGYMRSLDFNE